MSSTVRVDVSPEVLQWAIARTDQREQLERQYPLEKWLHGELKPTLHQLEGLAKKTYVPLGVFFLSHPPKEELPIPCYRTFGDEVRNEPSPNLLDTVRMMENRQAWLREYLIEDGFQPKSFVGSAQLFPASTMLLI